MNPTVSEMAREQILALDPAAKCGYAHSAGLRGCWELNAEDPRGVAGKAAPLGLQHVRLCNYLDAIIETLGCTFIASENAGFGSPNPEVQASHNERLGVIRMVAARHGIRMHVFNIGTIKLFATGNGHATKDQMVRACSTLLKITAADDNVADAVWILELAKRPDCWVITEKKKRRASKSNPQRRLKGMR